MMRRDLPRRRPLAVRWCDNDALDCDGAFAVFVVVVGSTGPPATLGGYVKDWSRLSPPSQAIVRAGMRRAAERKLLHWRQGRVT